ncbi:tripartite tricarboxylate transporter TctB family protein [Vreelandella arcis]|uniref:Tripartite tricarboxylate transporter TctB family protein n=1 Tax=Vreelandella arcis TaxID=416873 RepID=A0A1H0JGV5_9GAMM|nr:tripartite tricarboxylate transporter TctB family protein [Halomonas arcis]SDO42802.1 Tripartite tricarboxylate transporter TctB family protein [Halomonas arcis]
MITIFRLRYEISFLVLSLTIGVLIFISARGLPEPTYEPMGAAAFPIGIASITVFLVLLKVFWIFVEKKNLLSFEDDEESQLSLLKSFCMLLIFIIFVALVCLFNISFWVCAFLFMLLAMAFLKKPNNLRSFAVQCVLLIFFSLVLDYVVTDILYFKF